VGAGGVGGVGGGGAKLRPANLRSEGNFCQREWYTVRDQLSLDWA
jgi:hypothetical protein